MADRVLRGSRLGAVSYETDRDHDLAPRRIARYRCDNGEEFDVPFADEAEIPGTWICKNGLEGTLVEAPPPRAEEGQTAAHALGHAPRTPLDRRARRIAQGTPGAAQDQASRSLTGRLGRAAGTPPNAAPPWDHPRGGIRRLSGRSVKAATRARHNTINREHHDRFACNYERTPIDIRKRRLVPRESPPIPERIPDLPHQGGVTADERQPRTGTGSGTRQAARGIGPCRRQAARRRARPAEHHRADRRAQTAPRHPP